METLKVFLSCPGDVSNEKEQALKAIQRVSETTKEILGISLEAIDWRRFAPEAPRLPDERIQDILNAEIPKCQIFLLILWKRYGSIEPHHRKANCQREAEIALDLLKREKKLMFLTYFRWLEPETDKGSQRKSVEVFRNKLEKQGVWYRQYETPSDFYDQFTHDLYSTILKYRLSTRKHNLLRKFWGLGQPERPTSPNLGIFYPSMDRAFMGPSEDQYVWLNRLEPNVVFEDFKALQKIEKTLRLIGFHDFRIYNTVSIPREVSYMNRFWICLPRNTRGIAQADSYSDISRFTLVRRKNRASSFIKWKPSKSRKPIIVKSPLAKYLHEQRSKMDLHGEWRQEMDQIIAKDYAILARFRDRSNVEMREGNLYDYFLAGLRGLGTWGAAWFIDRKYSMFENIKEGDDVQFLLEIEFRNGRIHDVRDVSQNPQSYFDNENGINTVKHNIVKHNQV